MARELIQSFELIQVSSKEELSRTVASYLSQGFEMVTQEPASVHLIKRKRFKPESVLLLLLWIFPFFLYLAYYQYLEKDRLLEVRIASAGAIAGSLPPDLGRPPLPEAEPTPGAGSVPPQVSSDGTHWWDGTRWHRVPS